VMIFGCQYFSLLVEWLHWNPEQASIVMYKNYLGENKSYIPVKSDHRCRSCYCFSGQKASVLLAPNHGTFLSRA
jgi:hypothetical protein